MKSGVLGDLAACEELLPGWSRLAAPGASLIFTSAWWALAAWRHFPDLGQPRLVAAWSDAGELAGVLPLTACGDCVTWAGSPLGDEHDVHVDRRVDRLAIGRELVVAAVGELGKLRLTDARPGGTVARLGVTALGCPAPILPLTSPDRAFGELACVPGWSRGRRRGLRSRRDMLREIGTLRLERVSDPDALAAAVHTFARTRLASWADRARYDELPEIDRHQNFPSFIAEVGSELARTGRCHLDRLLLDESPVAQGLYFRTDSAYLLYMSTYEPRFARYSPSHLLLAASAEVGIGEGVTTIELGRGDEAYKFDHGAIPRHLEDVDL